MSPSEGMISLEDDPPETDVVSCTSLFAGQPSGQEHPFHGGVLLWRGQQPGRRHEQAGDGQATFCTKGGGRQSIGIAYDATYKLFVHLQVGLSSSWLRVLGWRVTLSSRRSASCVAVINRIGHGHRGLKDVRGEEGIMMQPGIPKLAECM